LNIPRLKIEIPSSTGRTLTFELEVDQSGFRRTTERGMRFSFERGVVVIDVMASAMKVLVNDAVYEVDLQTKNSDHADGDERIARALVGTELAHAYKAEFTDSIVQLANFVGLISEQQSRLKSDRTSTITQERGRWMLAQ